MNEGGHVSVVFEAAFFETTGGQDQLFVQLEHLVESLLRLLGLGLRGRLRLLSLLGLRHLLLL